MMLLRKRDGKRGLMLVRRKLIIGLYVVLLILWPKAVYSQSPIYAEDSSYVKIGTYQILKALEKEPLNSNGSLLGKAGGHLATTTWGPEIRMTFGDSTSYMRQPHTVAICGDTIFMSYGCSDSWSELTPYLMKSTDNGDSWSNAWQIMGPETAREMGSTFINYYRHRLNIGGRTDELGDHYFYNIYTKVSSDLGFNWTNPSIWLDPDRLLIGRCTGTSCQDTLLFGFHDAIDYFDRNIDRLRSMFSTNNGLTWSTIRSGPYYHTEAYDFYYRYSMGRIHLVYQEDSPDDNLPEIFYCHSEDWGQTWSQISFVSDDSCQPSQWPYLFATPDGKLLVTWYDYKYGYGGGGFTGDILYRVSLDNGETWGEEMQLTDNHQATASTSFIEGDHIGIVWEDCRTGFFQPELYYTESFDFGETWSDELRLTNAQGISDIPRLYLGDNRIFLFWTDARDNDDMTREIYFRKAEIYTDIKEDQAVIPTMITVSCYPNPFNSSVKITVNNYEGGDVEIRIYDVAGRLVKSIGVLDKEGKTTWDATDNVGRRVSSGIYFAQVETPQGKSTTKLLLLR